jgi:precorrin-6B methylase 2
VGNELGKINDLTWAYRESKVLQVANSLGIFERLSNQKLRVDEICRVCKTKPDLTERLLIACVAMGLLDKDDQCYFNSDFANKYLTGGKKLYQGNMIAHSAKVWQFWDKLEDQIRETEKESDPKEDHRNFIMAMENITLGERGKLFLDNIDLSHRKKLFDVGGGPGTYSILACKKYPQLEAVVFDLPETIAIAKEVIEREKMQDRITVIEGNWSCDCFGCENDVVLLSNVLHGGEIETAMKLKKAYDSLTGGGLLVIQEFLLNANKSGPLIPALFNIMVGAFSTEEIKRLIKETGFIDVEIQAVSKDFSSTWLKAAKP